MTYTVFFIFLDTGEREREPKWINSGLVYEIWKRYFSDNKVSKKELNKLPSKRE